MTDREIIKALVNVIEPKSVTEEALKQIIIGLLEEDAPKKVKAKANTTENTTASPKKKPGRKPIDWPKAEACKKAGWSIPKIADELKCAEATVYNHFKSLEV